MLSPSPSPYQQALNFLYGRINYERAAVPRKGLQLDRMRRLMEALGDPHLKVPIIHVAGTKGKGSVAAMLAACLQASGYRTGLHTSPHLERLEERFAMDGQACSEQRIVDLVERMASVIDTFDRDNDPPTFFELTTAMAFLHFAEQGADVAVVEVGMGGRLDSTNVCQPSLAVITSISFDHTKALGDTLEAIATEKAGIIKPGVPVVSGVLSAGARRTIARIAAERECHLLQLGTDFDAEHRAESDRHGERRSVVCYRSQSHTISGFDEAMLAMLGEHQVANAAVAIASLAELSRQGWNVTAEAIRQGLAVAQCPARVELVGRSPTVILDAAHNAAAASALAETIQQYFPDQKRHLLLAIARDKDAAAVLAPLAPYFDDLTVTRFQSNPRSADPAEVAEIASQIPTANWTVRTIADPSLALEATLAATGESDLVCIAGSFFLAAELRSTLLTRRDSFERPTHGHAPSR